MIRLRARDWLAGILLCAAVTCAALTAEQWLALRADNARIEGFLQGRDAGLPRHAAADLHAARGVFLLSHDRVDDAQIELDSIADATASNARATLLYGLANAHLKHALAIFNAAPMRRVAPLIALAQSEYRQVLRMDPGNWDARYNFDIASGLTHDADVAAYLSGDDMARERALVPDAPGAPNGLP
jgi:mxaK protein